MIHQNNNFALQPCCLCDEGPFLKIGRHLRDKHSISTNDYRISLSAHDLHLFDKIERELIVHRQFNKKNSAGTVCKICKKYLKSGVSQCDRCNSLSGITAHTCKICQKSGINLLKRHLSHSHQTNLSSYIDTFNCLDEYERAELSLLTLRQKRSPFSKHSSFYDPTARHSGPITAANSNKAWNPSHDLQSWIDKFGERIGAKKYYAWSGKMKSRYPTIIHNIAQSAYGGDIILAKQHYDEKISTHFDNGPTRLVFYTKQGASHQQAHERLTQYQHSHILNKNPLFKYYWMTNGHSDTEATLIAKQNCDTRSINAIMRRHSLSKHDAIKKQQIINAKITHTLVAQYKNIPTSHHIQWRKYRKEVDYYTKISWKNFFSLIDNKHTVSKRSKEWHLDHKFSKIHGFIYSIPPQIIGSPVNLSIISATENCKKKSNSSIIISELTHQYNKATEWNTLLQNLT